jgi:hypothetical protein
VKIKTPIAFSSDSYIAKLEYDGQTGMVTGYMNNIEVISCDTGVIISKKRYGASTNTGTAYEQFTTMELPVEPDLKLYPLTSILK